MEQFINPEIISQPLDQIEKELLAAGNGFKIKKENGKLHLAFDSAEEKESGKKYQNEITFFQIDGNLFYELGKDTAPEECEKIIKKIEEKFDVSLYI